YYRRRRLIARTLFTYTTLFRSINETGQTILMVTHSTRAASYSKRVLFIRDGAVYHEIYRGHDSADVFMDRIVQSLKVLSSRGERSEEHTSELQSRENLVCRLLL